MASPDANSASNSISGPDHPSITPIISLGVYTITAYGTWAYGFGVLLEPISADTGWGASFLGAMYGWAMALSGIGAFWAGRLLDRFGANVPYSIHAVVASGLMASALAVENRWLFAALFATGAGLAGATGFYTITTVIVSRIRADRPEWAINALTIVGAFSSPIYLPLTAWLVSIWHWRSVAALLVGIGALGAIQAAFLARGGVSPATAGGPSAHPIATLRRALANPAIRRILTIYLLAGAAGSTIWVYQVPMMTGVGLSLGLAGTFGGLRGLCQLLGRVGLAGQIERRGTDTLLRGAYLATAAAGLTLLFGRLIVGPDPVATGTGLIVATAVFAVLAGAGLGASSPLQAIHARSRFDAEDLGLLMGLQGLVLGVAGGIGPFAGGLVRDLSGSWTATIMAVVVVLVAAATLLTNRSEQEIVNRD